MWIQSAESITRSAVRWSDPTGIMTHTIMLECCSGKSSHKGHDLSVISETGDQYCGLSGH